MNKPLKHLDVWPIIGLHLIPGALISAFFFLIGPTVIRTGFPPIMGLLLGILFILIPFELGFLLYQGKKQNGQLSLKGIVLFRERVPIWQMGLLVIVLLGWSMLVFLLLPKADLHCILETEYHHQRANALLT